MNKLAGLLADLKDEVTYWVTGRHPYYHWKNDDLQERWWEFKEILWRLSRRIFYCPRGKHQVKMDANGCILCKKSYSEIFKK